MGGFSLLLPRALNCFVVFIGNMRKMNTPVTNVDKAA